jgi:AcrR family transcriptional regulator
MSAPAPTRDAGPFFAGFIEGRKGEILDAALGVFAEKGYEGGTMRDIATRVGVTEPALYRHFGSKQELFETLITAAGERMRDEAFDLLDRIRPQAMRESLLSALDDRRTALRRYAPMMRTLVVAASYDERSLTVLRETVAFPVAARVATVARSVDACFGLRRSEAERGQALRAFISLFVGTVVTSLVLEDTPDAHVVDAMLRVMGWSPDELTPRA